MKNQISCLALLLISFQSIGQISISGEIKNAPKDAVAEIIYYNNTIEWIEISASKVKLDSLGNFKMSFTWSTALSANLTIAEQSTNLFLIPGDSLHLSVDYNKFDETVHYSGKGSADNNYLAADLLADLNTKANRYNAFNDANKFKLYIDSLETLNNEFLKTHDSSEFTKEFRNYITATTKYRFINPRWMYKIGYNRTTKTFFDKPVPENYFDFLKTLDLNDENAFDNINYSVAIERYLSELHDSKVIVPDSLSGLQKVENKIQANYLYRKSILKNKVLDYQLTNFLKEQIGLIASDTKFTEELIGDYKSTCKNPDYISIIDNIYLKTKKLSAGNPAPDFTMTNFDGKSFSLSSLKGKVVFVDFWATWCVPCISAMPKTHQLMVKFADNKDVAFINVNIGDDIGKWKNFVTNEKIPGENLFANKEQTDELYKLFNFNGIPHYVLIDKKGNIIDANADNSEVSENKIKVACK